MFPVLLSFKRLCLTYPKNILVCNQFHSAKYVLGLEEFIEIKKANELQTHGRSWTPSDLRRKVVNYCKYCLLTVLSV